MHLKNGNVKKIFIFFYCRRSLTFPEFTRRTLRTRNLVIVRYRTIQLIHRLLTIILLQTVLPLVIIGCVIFATIFFFVLIRFFSKLDNVTLIMVITIGSGLMAGIWVVLYFSFQLTRSSQEFLGMFRFHFGRSKLGRKTFNSLEPLFVQVGSAFRIKEITVLTLFRIVLECVVNLLIAVE